MSGLTVNPQLRELYFKLKIILTADRLEGPSDLETKPFSDLSSAEKISNHQLDFLFLDLFYNVVDDFLFAHNIIYEDFDVSCYTNQGNDYFIKISYIKTLWKDIQELRDLTCCYPECSEEIYEKKLCANHVQEFRMGTITTDNLEQYAKDHQTHDQKLYQEYCDEEEIKSIYQLQDKPIGLVLNFPLYDHQEEFIPLLGDEYNGKNEEEPLYLSFFLILQPTLFETDTLLEIEFPEDEFDDDDDIQSELSIDDLSVLSLDLDLEDFVEENMHEDNEKNLKDLDQLIESCNLIEKQPDINEIDQMAESDFETSDDDSDMEDEIDLENDPDFQDLKEEFRKRL